MILDVTQNLYRTRYEEQLSASRNRPALQDLPFSATTISQRFEYIIGMDRKVEPSSNPKCHEHVLPVGQHWLIFYVRGNSMDRNVGASVNNKCHETVLSVGRHGQAFIRRAIISMNGS